MSWCAVSEPWALVKTLCVFPSSLFLLLCLSASPSSLLLLPPSCHSMLRPPTRHFLDDSGFQQFTKYESHSTKTCSLLCFQGRVHHVLPYLSCVQRALVCVQCVLVSSFCSLLSVILWFYTSCYQIILEIPSSRVLHIYIIFVNDYWLLLSFFFKLDREPVTCVLYIYYHSLIFDVSVSLPPCFIVHLLVKEFF